MKHYFRCRRITRSRIFQCPSRQLTSVCGVYLVHQTCERRTGPVFGKNLRSRKLLVEDAIQVRGHSLLWSRAGNRKKTSKEDADPEAQIVERLKQRDEPAFLELYDRHRRSVYWFLVHMTGSVALRRI